MEMKPQREHRWLDKLVGEWTYTSEFAMVPDQPPWKGQGVEVVRSLGGFWTVGEGEGDTPDGGKMATFMTLGYDPALKRYVGTFVGDGMASLWIYNGSLDAEEKVLSLDTEGPSFSGEGTSPYVDRMEFVDDDHRILTSRVQGEDGQWTQFMTTHYHRRKS